MVSNATDTLFVTNLLGGVSASYLWPVIVTGNNTITGTQPTQFRIFTNGVQYINNSSLVGYWDSVVTNYDHWTIKTAAAGSQIGLTNMWVGNAIAGNRGKIINIASTAQNYSTNVTLVSATSLRVFFSPGYTDTLFTVNSPYPITARTTNSFTWALPTLTLSGVLEGAINHK